MYDYVSVFSFIASYLNAEQSHLQSDLAAMAISDDPAKSTIPKVRGNLTKMFGGQQTKKATLKKRVTHKDIY